MDDAVWKKPALIAQERVGVTQAPREMPCTEPVQSQQGGQGRCVLTGKGRFWGGRDFNIKGKIPIHSS